GKTEVRGTEGVVLTVTDLGKTPRGDLKVSVTLAYPLDVQPGQAVGVAARAVPAPAGLIIRQQIWVASEGPPQAPGTFEYGGLSLLDAKGRPFEIGPAQQDSTGFGPQQGWTQSLHVTFLTKADGAAEPAKLVFTGSRPTLIEAPFTLKDIPLP